MIPPDAYARLREIAWVHAPPQAEPGDENRIGRYRIVEKIGAGAASEVFQAIDPEGQSVAIKILRRRSRRTRYLREVELLERTSQRQGVVAFLDAGRCGRGPYLVLELAEGGSLRSKIKRAKRLPWVEAVDLVIQLSDCLGSLHAEGIIHRDLKPENILLQGDGTPLISDFGLAKDLGEDDGDLTAAGFALGTVGYMAPELLEGRREQLGPWTDVFALGAMLYELVVGKPPFSGKTLNEAARSILEDAVPNLPGAPRALSKLTRRCLAKEPKRRLPDGASLAKALREVRGRDAGE